MNCLDHTFVPHLNAIFCNAPVHVSVYGSICPASRSRSLVAGDGWATGLS